MLRIALSLSELNFGQLMSVYQESNQENALAFYGGIDRNLAVLNAEQDFYQYLNEIFFSTEGAVYAVWEIGKRYVSALRLEPYQDGLLLEALETAPDDRRRGYATALIEAACTWLTEQGYRKIYSHVSKDNIPSLKVHAARGFQVIHNYAEYIDGTTKNTAYTLCLMIL